MGSPSAELNVLESFRPWYQNGLQFIFKDALPGIEELEKGPARQRTVTPAKPQANRQPAQGVGQSAARSSQPQQRSAQNGPNAGQNTGQSAGQGFRQPTPSPKPSRVPPPRKPSVQQEKCLPDPASWEAPWSTIASRITPRLQIFWTYAQLGQDLSGQADPERRMLFQSLIGYMGLPKGAISFWPCTTWNGSEFENRPEVFWKGVKDYDVKFVACFGDQTRSVIAPEAPANAASAYVNNVQLVMLQDPDFLKTLPKDEQQLLSISLLRLPLF